MYIKGLIGGILLYLIYRTFRNPNPPLQPPVELDEPEPFVPETPSPEKARSEAKSTIVAFLLVAVLIGLVVGSVFLTIGGD